ncbi:MAG: beta-lactamase family protein [Bacteroidia bacterium]
MKGFTNKLILVSVFMLSLLSCKTGGEKGIEKIEKSKFHKIDNLGNRYLELNRFSGSILVAKDNRIVYNRSFGLADYENEIPFSPKSAFKIGELSKLITIEILNNLVEEKKVNSTESISDYLINTKPDISVSDFLNLNPNVDYNIAGRLIEKVTDKSYQENISEYAEKLKLEHTYYNLKKYQQAIGYLYHNHAGNGLELQRAQVYNLKDAFSSKGLKSTCNDLMKILKSYNKPISIDGYLDKDGFSYALLHNVENGRTIIILSNRRHPVAGEILNSISSILDEKEYKLPLLRKPFNIEKTSLKDFAGNYLLNENVSFKVYDLNDRLFVQMGSNNVYLVPQSTNQFYMKEMDASMRFLRDSIGLVDRVVLLNGFINSEQIAMRKE